MTVRKKGLTTQQVKDAPFRAIFIWCTNDLAYPRYLLRKRLRGDIQLQPRGVIDQLKTYCEGVEYPTIIVDHALEEQLTKQQRKALRYWNSKGTLHIVND